MREEIEKLPSSPGHLRVEGFWKLHSFLRELGLVSASCRWTSCKQHRPNHSGSRPNCAGGAGCQGLCLEHFVPKLNLGTEVDLPRRCPFQASLPGNPPSKNPDFTQGNRPRFMGPDSICFSARRFFPDRLRSDKRGPITPMPKRNKLPSLSAGRPLGALGPPEKCAKQPS